jgi:hypothetical protein
MRDADVAVLVNQYSEVLSRTSSRVMAPKDFPANWRSQVRGYTRFFRVFEALFYLSSLAWMLVVAIELARISS